MADGRFAIIDPAAGISGDMLLGALIAAGAPPEWLQDLPARLGVPEVTVSIETVDRCGIRCTKVNVMLPRGRQESPAEPFVHSHAHSHSHPHDHHGHEDRGHGAHDDDGHHPAQQLDSSSNSTGPHQHISELIARIERSPLSAWVRERALRAFHLLGEAESRVHGVPVDQVALHEVGAMDALVDIVGAIEGFERLGVSRIYNRAVGLGDGWVRAAHGALSVPAPATAILLEGLQIGDAGPVTGEAVTPTGAVLLRVLSDGPPPARWRAVAGGAWGAGGRNPASYPNALRLLIAEPAAEAVDVVIVSTDLDDMSPEYLEPLREALVAAGALDVQVWTTQMKKGRVGFRVEAVVAVTDADRVADACFHHSTTAGVRRQPAQRVTLARREVRVEADDGSTVRVKVLDTPGGPHLKPEFEDVAALARRTGRPAHELARDLHDRAFRLMSSDGANRPQTPNKES
ncbi:MAG TPA: LarC family nickel insertion protein [Gemmatimonadales bacterium]|nr:LarC family nickel insertion protein [Gemmatimonadales bacterium]